MKTEKIPLSKEELKFTMLRSDENKLQLMVINPSVLDLKIFQIKLII